MDVVAGLASLPSLPEPALVVVGVFDGLHRGHAHLLRRLVAEARRRGARPMVVTFDHHPDEVLTGTAPPLLCDPHERLVRLQRAGVRATVYQHFDLALRETPYDRFVRMISDRTPLAGFLMTPDAAFGFNRGGTPQALETMGGEEGWAVVVVPPFSVDGRPVRSTEVRAHIEAGNLTGARHLLGRAHAVAGDAAEPTGEGSEVRFALPVALPRSGTYRVAVEPAWRMGVSPGRPTTRRAVVEDGRLVVRGPVEPGPIRVAFPRGPS